MEKYYGGIDLGARYSQICVINDRVSKLVQKKVKNEWSQILPLLGPFQEGIKLVVESTFNWYWLIDGLQDEGYDVCLAHTLGLSMITKAKIKTDKRDAFTLAKLLKAEVIPEAYIYPKETRHIRDLLRRRLKLVNKRAEELAFINRSFLGLGCLNHTREDIQNLKWEDIVNLDVDPMVQFNFSLQLDRIALYSKQIKELEDTVLSMAKQNEEFQMLLTLPGIGPILAMTIFYEVGEIFRFKNAKHFASYCRVVPGVAQSGKSCRRGRGSKQGNHYLKWALSLGATHAVRSYPKIRKYFNKHLNRHVGNARKIITYNIIAHKLAQAVYQVMRYRVPYKEELMFGN